MRRLLLIAGLCTPFVGCSVIGNGIRTVFVEPLTYPAKWEEHRALERYRACARETWAKTQEIEPGEYSPDYVCGFQDGFVDYLDAGGNGEPPALPPRKYWRVEYETAAGQAAMRDWFAGFRHGAAIARQSGARRCATVPSSVATCAHRSWQADGPELPTAPMPFPPATETVPTPAGSESLPPNPSPPLGSNQAPVSMSSFHRF